MVPSIESGVHLLPCSATSRLVTSRWHVVHHVSKPRPAQQLQLLLCNCMKRTQHSTAQHTQRQEVISTLRVMGVLLCRLTSWTRLSATVVGSTSRSSSTSRSHSAVSYSTSTTCRWAREGGVNTGCFAASDPSLQHSTSGKTLCSNLACRRHHTATQQPAGGPT